MTMLTQERIFVALDTNDPAKALGWAELLRGKVGGFKIGLEFITAMFAQLMITRDPGALLETIRTLFAMIGPDLFWDGKWDDIPNTVQGAAVGIQPLAPQFVNVHASAGPDAVVAAVAGSAASGSKVLVVTLLTSIGPHACVEMFGAPPEVIVPRWAKLAKDAGAHGLICSADDLNHLNQHQEEFAGLPKMTPAIRPTWSVKGDQSRITTPAKAIQLGADYLVVGRPITTYPENLGGPEHAVEMIVQEIDGALESERT